MFVLYIIGYVITLFILFSCRGGRVQPPLIRYLDDMGVLKPFSCTNGNFASAMMQALIWPWPFFIVGLLILLLPLLIIFALFKK